MGHRRMEGCRAARHAGLLQSGRLGGAAAHAFGAAAAALQLPVLNGLHSTFFPCGNQWESTGMHPAAPTAPPAHLYAPRRKLYTDCRLALERKLVAREAAQQIGLANARVANKHHFEQVVVAAAGARQGRRQQQWLAVLPPGQRSCQGCGAVWSDIVKLSAAAYQVQPSQRERGGARSGVARRLSHCWRRVSSLVIGLGGRHFCCVACRVDRTCSGAAARACSQPPRA